MGSTNADMQNTFSQAIAFFQGTPFLFAFLHNDLSRPAMEHGRPAQQALLQFSTLDGELASLCLLPAIHILSLQRSSTAVLQALAMHSIVYGVQQKQPEKNGTGF